MSCCIKLDEVVDWYGWEDAQPQEITDLIARANLTGGPGGSGYGTRTRVTDFASQSWVDPFVTMISQPTCQAVGTDKAANTADAERWMFDHKTWNSSSTLPLPLRKVMFMRAGTNWRMQLQVLLSGP